MSVQAQAEVKPAPTPVPSLTPAPAGLASHTCACGGSHGLGGECDECRQKRLRVRRRALNAPDLSMMQMTSSTHSVSGYNFGRVSVTQARREQIIDGQETHDEQEADRAATQVVQGVAPALTRSSTPIVIRRQAAEEETSGENASNPEVEATETVEPIANEATPEAAGSEPASAIEPIAEAQGSGLIIEDAVVLGPGQMSKSAFLDELRASACAVADAELAAVGRSTEGCPYIERWIGYYRTRDSGHIERAIRKYAPETAAVTNAREYIPLVSERIRQGTARWARTGDLSGVPEELLSQASGAGLLSGIGSAVSSAVSGIGGLFFKARAGGAREANPQAIQSQLRSGSPLDGGVRTRMESAFGYDFSRVRVHADGQAAQLSSGLNARAFTVGSDVAFGAGEYRPGTLVGDALLAHELAHVVQQGGAVSTDVPQQKGDGAYTGLEEDADQSAVGAVVSLWSGAKGGLAKIAQSAMPRLRSGLRLSRCKNQQGTPTGSISSASISGGVTGLTMNVTATYSDCTACQDGLEAMQVAWATGGAKVGVHETVFPPLSATYYTFVDGGRNSPGGAVYSGDHPYYIGRADLPASYGYTAGQGSAGSVSGCTVNVQDQPTAVTAYDEAYFETAFVCLNYQGTGRDKLLEAFQWGFINQGTTAKPNPTSAPAGGIVNLASPSAKFEETLRADYPAYSHT